MIGIRHDRPLWPLVAAVALLMATLAMLLDHPNPMAATLRTPITLGAVLLAAAMFWHCTAQLLDRSVPTLQFDQVPIGIFQLSATRHILAINPTVEKYLGYEANELLGVSIDTLIHPDELQKFTVECEALAGGRKNRLDCEMRFMSKASQPLWVQLGMVATNRRGEGSTGYVATINSIQALKRYESLLSANEKKFRTITDSVETVVWMSSPGIDRTLYINSAYEKIWGCSCDSLYANPRSFLDAIHPDDRPRVETELEHATDRLRTKYRIIRPDGELRFIRDSGSMVYDDDGNPLYMIGTAVDITLEVTLQNRMRETVNQLQVANDRLEQMIKIDPLTQCYTRQVLMDEMEKELSRFRRYGTASTLVFIDLNRFKYINDTWGHTVGDAALRATADMIRHQIRETDLLARYAGDEFVLLLKQTDGEAAQAVVDKLRATTIRMSAPEHRDIEISASYGTAPLCAETTTPTAWIHRADKAMYEQKRD